MNSEESFFDFDDSFDSVQDLLNDSYAGIEDSGEGDTAIFFEELTQELDQRQEEITPVNIESTVVDDNFEESIDKLDDEVFSDLEEIKDLNTISDEDTLTEDDLELFVSSINDNLPPVEESIEDTAEDEFNLDNIDTDELLDMLNTEEETVEGLDTDNKLTPLYDEPVITDDLLPLAEEKDNEEITTLVDEVVPVIEEYEEITPLYDDVVQDTPVNDIVQEVSYPETIKVFEETVEIPTMKTLGRIVKILDTYASFTDDEKHSTLLLLYAGSISIEARDKVVQKVLSITDAERLTIQTLKELKQLDSVERAFSLMDLPDQLLDDVSELVYYVSEKDRPKGLNKINLSREVVKHIEKLNSDIVGYIEKATEIVSI